jgi:phospholipid/cholesterol/gamma-HCH transport system substrate-binding protein
MKDAPMNEQAIRFRIGIFVLAGLIALGVLILLFGGRPYFFVPSTTYTIHFDNAQGVAPGTPVRRSGVKIGEVRKVTLDDTTGQVEVLIQIDDGFKIRKGDRPTIVPTILGGDVTVAFLPPADRKDMDTSFVEPGAVLEGYVQADTGKLLQKTSDVIQPAEDALKEIKKALEKIDKLVPVMQSAFEKIDKVVPDIQATFTEVRDTVKKLAPEAEKTLTEVQTTLKKLTPEAEKTLAELNKSTLPDIRKSLDEFQVLARSWNKVGERVDLFMRNNEDKLTKTIDKADEVLRRVNEIFSDENQKNLRETLKNVRAASDRFDAIAKSADEFLRDGKVTLKTMNDSFLKVDGVLTDLQKATKPLAERGENIIKNLDEISDKLNRSLTDVREFMQSVMRGQGTVQKLLADPSLYNNLNDASLSLSRLMPRFDHIMRDIEIFADKLARHPELLGLRGAVAPGSGLKEAPSQYKVIPQHP